MYEPNTLLIFDIDGTLTDSAGLTRIAFEKAVYEMYSINDSARGIIPYGKTDQQIPANRDFHNKRDLIPR